MPLYEYQCPACGAITEEIASAGTTEIPCACGKASAKRRLSAFSVGGQSATPYGSASSQCGIGGDSSHTAGCSCCCGGGGHHHH